MNYGRNPRSKGASGPERLLKGSIIGAAIRQRVDVGDGTAVRDLVRWVR